jgi:hypothetical protein
MKIEGTGPGEERSLTLLSQEQTRDVVALAQHARKSLSRFVGREITIGTGAMELLDEWIEDYLETDPDPPVRMRLLWASLLGEMFRRHHKGWWALRDGRLTIVCPTDRGNWHVAAVREQVDRRVVSGMSESLTYFYNMTRIELKLD